MANFDVSKLDEITNQTLDEVEITITHPNGQPLDIRFRIVSTDHPRVRKVVKRNINLMQRAQQRGRPLSAEQVEDLATDVVVAHVVWWNLEAHGEPTPCTEENVKAILNAHRWIERQVVEARDDAATFLRGSDD
ncbi:hypothetical protein L1787_13115 [Acuticoccus sp. M5D2P5]|uniref:hypothetical protein n=1 Tax=Acuticoccus kalidii TaxID=2910977 RepID=UPI001F3D3B56|nr:hypothetical protein [Acuticoccus kalidii]MCF3934350.1 hypothetical protein [Acuticoccus kalidii]